MTQNWPDWSPDDATPPPPPGGPATDVAPVPGWGDPPQPPSRRGWLIAAVIGAVVVGLGFVVVAAVLVARSNDAPDPVVATAEPTPDQDSPVPKTDPPVRAQDFDDPRAAVTADLLQSIDASELAMIGFQVGYRDGVDDNGVVVDGGARLVVAAAEEGAATLRELEIRLAAIEQDTGEAVTDGHLEIRDTYVLHLVAWKDYMTAVADDPSLLEFDNAASAPFSDDIATTADDFVAAMRRGLPDDTPQELRDYATFILERGFVASEEGDGELV